MTSSNTGVPDISGSVYNKTQVSKAGPSSLMARGQADGWPCRALVAGAVPRLVGRRVSRPWHF